MEMLDFIIWYGGGHNEGQWSEVCTTSLIQTFDLFTYFLCLEMSLCLSDGSDKVVELIIFINIWFKSLHLKKINY